MQGYQILARSLAIHNIEYCYGIVGVPVIQLGFAIQGNGIKYYGCRNQQQASYSAGAIGFLTQKPGVCLVVSGPGHTNAISGIANAWSNRWPMILISGASDLNQMSQQAFQQCQQEILTKPFCKYSVRITDATTIPFHVEKAIRLSTTGRPGPVYLQLPGDVLKQPVEEKNIDWRNIPIELPLFVPLQKDVNNAVELLKNAKNPLVIVGKGMAYSLASQQITEFINLTKIPFLPTPLGKGVVPDSHALNVSAGRSTALGKADVIVLAGARLNWILHFGLQPRFDPKVKIIQIDICAQETSHNVISAVNLVGDGKHVFKMLNSRVKEQRWQYPADTAWNKLLKEKCETNSKVSSELMNKQNQFPMTYYTSNRIIKQYMPKDCYLIGEGANTMDIGRTIFTHETPLKKLDAGSFGTMGIGIAFALAAKSYKPKEWVVTVMGDSAFGFSAMECQTLSRYQLGGVIFIINNNGIYSGVQALQGNPEEFPPTALNPKVRYQLLGEAFGGKGYKATTEAQLHEACREAFRAENLNRLTIINVAIEPSGAKKPQEHGWLTRKEPGPKL